MLKGPAKSFHIFYFDLSRHLQKSKVQMSDEELLIIPSRLCHFLMCEYISPHGVFHIPDGHMAQFPALCDYILQGRAQQVETHKKFKQIYGCS
jgi:hypothetical protein